MNALTQSAPERDLAAGEIVQILNEISARRPEFEQKAHVPGDMIEKLKLLGVYRAFVPKRLGGNELSPSDFCRLIEKIAEYDPSTAWVASFGMAPTYLCALPSASFQAVYADTPDTVFAGAAGPPHMAEKVKGGVRISGRWKYASGCLGASIIGVGFRLPESPLPRMAIVPRAQIQTEESWDVMGLAATGSHDLIADRIFVPDEWTFVRGGAPAFDLPLYRYPSSALAGQVLAIVGLGAARASLTAFDSLAGQDNSIVGAPPLGTRPHVQRVIAEAEAALRSARAFFYEATDEAFAAAMTGGTPSVEQTALVRLAASNAARTGAEVTRKVFSVASMTAIRNGHPILRNMNDAAVVAQHAFLGEGTWHLAGAILLGQSPQHGYP